MSTIYIISKKQPPYSLTVQPSIWHNCVTEMRQICISYCLNITFSLQCRIATTEGFAQNGGPGGRGRRLLGKDARGGFVSDGWECVGKPVESC